MSVQPAVVAAPGLRALLAAVLLGLREVLLVLELQLVLGAVVPGEWAVVLLDVLAALPAPGSAVLG